MKEISDRIKTEEFKEWNERMVKKYDPDAFHHHPNPLVRFIEKKRVKMILKLMNKHEKGDHILEVGCGAGNIIEKISQGKLFGIDISASIIIKANQKLNRKAVLFQADAQNLPFKKMRFQPGHLFGGS
jgi:ubiquinone/menaquinone biosynthesis C-methylase UbiE